MATNRQKLKLQAITTNIAPSDTFYQHRKQQNSSGTSLKLCLLGSVVLHTGLLTCSFQSPDPVQSPQPKADFIEVEFLTAERFEETASESYGEVASEPINPHDLDTEKAGTPPTSQIIPPTTKNSWAEPARVSGPPNHAQADRLNHPEDRQISDALTPPSADIPLAATQYSEAGAIGFDSGNANVSGISSGQSGEASQLIGLGTDSSNSFAQGTPLPSSGNRSTDEAIEPANNGPIVCLSCPVPDYFGAEGSARVVYDIAPNGSVTNLRVWESSGDPEIDQTVLATVSNWQFTPSRTGRQAVRNRLTFEAVGSAFQQHNRRRRQIELVRQQIASPSSSSASLTQAPAQTSFPQRTAPSASLTPTENSATPPSRIEAISPLAPTSPPVLAPPSLGVQPQFSPSSISTRAADLAVPDAATPLSIGSQIVTQSSPLASEANPLPME